MAISENRFDQYLLHRGELVDYATAIVGDRAGGEDIVQDAFIRLRSMAADRTIDEPLGYLRRIVRNLALDWVRRLSFERRLFDGEQASATVAADNPTQEQALSSRDDLRLLMQAVAELPERTRIALELHRFHGWKLKDIADHLGISPALAHNLVYEGLDHCRQRLAQPKAR
ncbi:sigma-70 family RNA polymerase sigma factor [Hyphomicrobium sp. D-2]|uniref:sigma-70 family RNA polymerase sigma factor n=1 Tax=Hyphomicrobium sp. D-2 TaxID=3041621 RepID=UPI002453FD2F|nr:sigma-70 family RNA polymerase sigma factor [Hyphomicrobium sp. D-2]MDH4980714.1 sigma-70 family RNA polymerase sigma factor [Hyphomicrobium sp. D-2]